MKAFPATGLVASRLCRPRPATALSRSATCATDAISAGAGALHMRIQVI
jgi:hypothetical protein